jgi:ligand-binding sensor domain-containing protein
MKHHPFLALKFTIFLCTFLFAIKTPAQRPVFQQIELPDEVRFVNALLADSNDKIWIASAQGLYTYSNNQFTRFYEENMSEFYQINALAMDKEGNMWFGTYNGLLVQFTNNKIAQSFDIKPKATNSNCLITSIAIDKNKQSSEEILLTTSGGEIFEVNPKTNSIGKIESPLKETETIYSILYGFSPTVWLCTSDGFYTMNKNSKWKKKSDMYTAYGLTENEGKYWAIGRDDHKMAVLMLYFNEKNDPNKRFVWKNFDLSLLTDIYTRFYELSFTTGEIAWIASQSGLVRYNPITGSVKVYEKDKNLNLKPLQHITSKDNQIWVSSSGRRFYKVDVNQ